MGSIKMCEGGIEVNYESAYKCPICGSRDRTLKISNEFKGCIHSDNVRFERCSCGRTLRTETKITVAIG